MQGWLPKARAAQKGRQWQSLSAFGKEFPSTICGKPLRTCTCFSAANGCRFENDALTHSLPRFRTQSELLTLIPADVLQAATHAEHNRKTVCPQWLYKKCGKVSGVSMPLHLRLGFLYQEVSQQWCSSSGKLMDVWHAHGMSLMVHAVNVAKWPSTLSSPERQS